MFFSMQIMKQMGAAMVEYAILLAFVCVVGTSFIGSDSMTNSIAGIVNNVASVLEGPKAGFANQKSMDFFLGNTSDRTFTKWIASGKHDELCTFFEEKGMSPPLFDNHVDGITNSGKVVSIPIEYVAKREDYQLGSTYIVRQYKCDTSGNYTGEYRDVQVTVKKGGGDRYYAAKPTALEGGTLDWIKE